MAAARPDITHLYGHIVEGIETIPGANDGEDTWVIRFADGPAIHNLDPMYELPDNSLIGMKLSTSVIDASMTRLFFGTDENPRATMMYLNPTQYAVSVPGYEGGKLVRPQSTEEERDEAGYPPAAPGERVVDGPDEDWQAAQSAADEQYVPDEEEQA